MNSSSSDIAAVIMAGGKGSRIGTLGQGKPKCMLRVGPETLLTRLISQLREAGIVQISICCSPENIGDITEFLEANPVATGLASKCVRAVSCVDCRLGPLPALAEVLSDVSSRQIWMCLADVYFTQSPFDRSPGNDEAIDADGWLIIGRDEMLCDDGGTGFVSRDGMRIRGISYGPPTETVQANEEKLRWSGTFRFRSKLITHLRENLPQYVGAPLENWIQGLLTSDVHCAWKDAGGFVNVNASGDYQYLVSRYGNGFHE